MNASSIHPCSRQDQTPAPLRMAAPAATTSQRSSARASRTALSIDSRASAVWVSRSSAAALAASGDEPW